MKILRMERNGKKPNLPKYQTIGSAGMDLEAFLQEDLVIKPDEIAKVPTGIAMEIKENHCGFVMGRSSLGAKYGVCPANGVGLIDSDYRGEIFVVLQNHGKQDFKIENGDRIAQIVIMPVVKEMLEETEQLSNTIRGDGGFGSTNK